MKKEERTKLEGRFCEEDDRVIPEDGVPVPAKDIAPYMRLLRITSQKAPC